MAKTITSRAGKGAQFLWLSERIRHNGDECLLWPFPAPNGYGVVGYFGATHYAHRLMCELAHGKPADDALEAAHECGNSRCVNPKHLAWKTPSANQADRAQHGTKSFGRRGKVTFQQAQDIRAMRGVHTQEEIAALYGITRSNVSHIQRGKHMTYVPKGFGVRRGKYEARIVVARKCTYLGSFKTEAEATAVFLAARERVKAGLPPKAA